MKKLFIISLALLVVSAAGLEWKRGQTLTIALPEKAEKSVLAAKAELEHCLPRALGVTVQTGSPETADIVLGDTELTRKQKFYRSNLPEEGFIVAVSGRKLFIYGHDGKFTGTLFGVEDFLSRELDITWIWAGESGEDIPARGTLKLPDFARTEAPGFMTRGFFFNTDPGFLDWARRMKLSNRSGGMFGGRKMVFGHSWNALYFKTPAAKEHPEWMAIYGGERRGPHLCTSNPELRKYIAEKAVEAAHKRKYDIINISPSDGYGFCECAECRKLDPPETVYTQNIPNLSNRHWDYAIAVADMVKKIDPKLGVGMFAYTAYKQAPTNVKRFPDNLYVSFCFSTVYFPKPESKAETYRVLAEYKKLDAKIIGREYWGMHYLLDFPYIYTGVLKESMPELATFGLVGMYGEAPGDFATNAPNYYLVSALMWNPKADSDAIMKRFYRAFGPAENEIRGYYETFERAVMQNTKSIPGFGYRSLVNAWPEIFPAPVLAEAEKHLAKAQKLANTPQTAERVRRVSVGFEHAKLRLKMLEVYRKLGRNGEPLFCFSLAGDIAEAEFHKVPLPADRKAFWETMPRHSLSKEERLAALREAFALGKEYEQFLKDNAEVMQFAVRADNTNEVKGIRPWRKTVKKLLDEETKK